jgi:hypothetical protein
MGRPLKVVKQNTGVNIDGSITSVYKGDGYPTDGAPTNGWDTEQPGVIGGWPQRTYQIEVPDMFLEQVGGGTITANTASAVVTGVGTMFEESGIDGATVYNSAGVELGVVDNIANNTSLTFAANCAANITAGSFTFADVDNGFIIRQKGKKKFLVARRDTINDEGIALGGTYMITDTSDTDWAALGAGPNASRGKIFTATASGANLTTDGEVYAVGTCTLVDGGTLGLNEFRLEVYNDDTETTSNAMSVTNRWVRDFDNSNNVTGTKFLASATNDSGDIDEATGYPIVIVGTHDYY